MTVATVAQQVGPRFNAFPRNGGAQLLSRDLQLAMQESLPADAMPP
jgi:hypothetical protein